MTTGDYMRCGHGKTYMEECPECDAAWFKDVTLPNLVTLAKRSAQWARNHPGIAERNLVSLVIGLSDSVAKLGDELERLKGTTRKGEK